MGTATILGSRNGQSWQMTSTNIQGAGRWAFQMSKDRYRIDLIDLIIFLGVMSLNFGWELWHTWRFGSDFFYFTLGINEKPNFQNIATSINFHKFKCQNVQEKEVEKCGKITNHWLFTDHNSTQHQELLWSCVWPGSTVSSGWIGRLWADPKSCEACGKAWYPYPSKSWVCMGFLDDVFIFLPGDLSKSKKIMDCFPKAPELRIPTCTFSVEMESA